MGGHSNPPVPGFREVVTGQTLQPRRAGGCVAPRTALANFHGQIPMEIPSPMAARPVARGHCGRCVTASSTAWGRATSPAAWHCQIQLKIQNLGGEEEVSRWEKKP